MNKLMGIQPSTPRLVTGDVELKTDGCIERNPDGSLTIASADETAAAMREWEGARKARVGLFMPVLKVKSSLVVSVLMMNDFSIPDSAAAMNVTAKCLEQYIKSNPTLDALVDTRDRKAIQEAEGALRNTLYSDNDLARLAAAKYILSTKGKDQGYTQRSEVMGQTVSVNISKSIVEKI